jgi:transposase-like protein
MTGLNYRSALFMMHRIRKAFHIPMPPGSLSGTVEVDETYIGGKRRRIPGGRSTRDNKTAVMAMVERGGRVRPFSVQRVTAKTLKSAIRHYVDAKSTIMTDDFPSYRGIGYRFEGGHFTVQHSKGEYVRRGFIHTNSVEGFFGLLKRGLNGTFHSVSKKHLHRYLSEFEFRYNTRGVDDGERTRLAIKAAEGKRLTYKDQLAGSED